MLKILVIALFSFSNCFGAVMADDKQSETEKEQVFSRLQEFTKSFNQGKADAVSDYWAPDAEIITPVTGQVVEGKQAVSLFIQNKIQNLKGRQISFEPKAIDFSDENSATVDGIVQITDQGKLVDRQARRVGLVKTDGKWFIGFLSEIPVDLPPTSYVHLKDLEWLLGNWIDQDNNVTIKLNGRWDKFKNFLIQTFDMKIYGVDTLEGMQIFGWDPIAGKIRAWVYDSDGGFGSGIWSKIDGGWSAKLNYTLSDGSTAESTNVYKDITDKSFSYSSFDRKVGDKKLPNIEPVTVIKE